MKYPSKIDLPVLVTFFARPDTTRQVFNSIREARPSKLLLWQDGPRNNDDMFGILACREIFEEIDWECEVHRNFHDVNMGCDPSTFRAQKWAFSIVDKCVILEDDMVPCQSFYSYCKELLEKYEYDERVNHICGVNFLGNYENCPHDYLFSYYGTGAWASWKRVADQWDETYSFLSKKYYMDNVKMRLPYIIDLEKAEKRKKTGFEWWEIIVGYNCYLNNRLVIIPKKNLVSNVGVVGGTHSSSLRLMSKKVRAMFEASTFELNFPLNHPEYIVPDLGFMNEMSKINCKGRPFLKFYRRIDYIVRCLIYGEFLNIIKRKFIKK